MIFLFTKRVFWLVTLCACATACKKDREDTPAPTDPVAPTITGFSPNSGQVGASVAINGTHFGTTTSGLNVVFTAGTANTAATISGVTDTKIETKVPAGLAPGAYTIKVTAGGKTVAANDNFTVLAPADSLAISGFSPASGIAGSSITITGTKFSPTVADNSVIFAQGDQEVTAAITAASATSLSVTVPGTLAAGSYTIKVKVGDKTVAASGTYSVQANGPTISSFAPASGEINTIITLTGTGFAPNAGQNSASFVQEGSARFALVTSATATSLTVEVPYVTPGTYKIQVTVGGKTVVTSTDAFTVTAPAAPVISDFTPTSGQVSTSVAINGNNFSANASANQVYFEKALSAVMATITEATPTRLTVTVPSGLSPGEYTLKVYKSGLSVTAAGTFRVMGPPPSISSFSPTTADVGDRITINGSRFSAVAGENTVTLVQGNTAVDLVIMQAGSSQLEVAVPSTLSAGSYQIRVTTNGQTVTSSTTFTATVTATEPIATSMSPGSVSRGGVLTLTGTNLKTTGRVTDLYFYPIGGGTTHLYSVAVNAEGTQISFTIPSNFPLGKFVVSISKRELSMIGEASDPYYGTVPGVLTVQ